MSATLELAANGFTAVGIVLAGLALHAGFRTDRTDKATVMALARLLFAFLFLLSPRYPWYLLALVPFLATGRLLAPWVLTTFAFILYDGFEFNVPDYFPLDLAMRKDLLYGATLIALAYDLISMRWPASRRLEVRS
jgi:hypothetical protein